MALEQSLAAWLPGQRWFAGKGAPLTNLRIVADTLVAGRDPALRHLILAVTAGERTEHYQVLIGLRSTVPDRLSHAVIGPAGPEGPMAYDALHDPELTRLLLEAMASGRTIGALRCAREREGEIDTALESLVLTGEQSNTSLLFGEDAILKVFRRPAPGPNADLEVPRALARLGSAHVAPPLGWIEGDLAGKPAVLAILSAYLRGATDGWTLAATSVRDLYASESSQAAQAGGDFAPEAHRLGEATAQVHRDLAEAFGTAELPSGAASELAAQMRSRLDAAIAQTPELDAHADKIRSAYDELARLDDPLLVQRVHGDYHLGQAMRTQAGWVLLDFEGEPASPVEQRRVRWPALRDVAGMLRSFEYAARHQLPGHQDRVREAARDWVRRNQGAFCAGYAEGGGADPGKHAALLRALVFDKAVYEVRYEATHRPSWVWIPLESLANA